MHVCEYACWHSFEKSLGAQIDRRSGYCSQKLGVVSRQVLAHVSSKLPTGFARSRRLGDGATRFCFCQNPQIPSTVSRVAVVTAATRSGYLPSNPANLGTALGVTSYGYLGFCHHVRLQNLLQQLQDGVQGCCCSHCGLWVSLGLYASSTDI